jgi:hypothetical protein
MFKPVVIDAAQFREPTQPPDESGIKRVFMVMHGYYGNLFLSKFSTGNVDGGEDQGIANARRIWAYGLRDFDGETVKTALRQCQQRHPEFPPSLPQFVSLCAANKPRVAYTAVRAIGMSGQLRSQYAAQARAIIEKHAARAVTKATGYVALPDGLDGLKQAIAGAVAAAGGNEAATLARLDRELTAGAA